MRHVPEIRSAAMLAVFRFAVCTVLSVSPWLGVEGAAATAPAAAGISGTSQAPAREAPAARRPTASAPT